MGFIATRAFIIAAARLMPLATYGASLSRISFAYFLYLYALELKLVFKVLKKLSKIPVGKLLILLSAFVLFLGLFRVSLDSFNVAYIYMLYLMVYCPVHKSFADFVCTISDLGICFSEHVSLGSLKFLPLTGILLTH